MSNLTWWNRMTSYVLCALCNDDVKVAAIDYSCVHYCMRTLYKCFMRTGSKCSQKAHIKRNVGNMSTPHW